MTEMQNITAINSVKRRHLVGGAALGMLAGAVGGLAGGVALGQGAALPQQKPSGKQRFADKVVIVTGGTSGIGRAATLMFAAEGGRVAFCGRNTDRGKQVETEVRESGGEAVFIRADLRHESEVKALVDATIARYGRLDVAFNNAGISIEKPLHEFSAAEFDDVIGTDLRGVFLSMKYQIPHMLEKGGSIVVTSSSNAIATSAKRSAYSAAKRGLVGLVQAAALDYAKHGIRINTLIPGTTDTPMIRRLAGMEGLPDAAWHIGIAQWAKSNVPGLQRVAAPEEIAAFALVLASDDHPYTTGGQFVIDGGKTAHG
ncbi:MULTISPECIES: SDR family oxidoreductase [unclassified Bradyrhizobium]|uniref:SDR family NAD(P)-dependent oxidoreductase n=1 Tax=unclassified Bradyrhizobium TaxID=2631580 RepID=UPI001CD4928C|nr:MULTISPECIES: SDR family oxidoreductase [unclassified Bradyrhizobium]MCA1378328.1 SDR family oxidoreductase [Bradyrhizobium sp. IC4060]MCA1487692.1 SDR family oxidoreductase [Bradyrhizobium sp. IC4061]MCA1542365.1 SDR family oxidoreductase [Bradyrhizobium sp. NBAIM32]